MEPQRFSNKNGLGGIRICFFGRFAWFHSLSLSQSSLSTAIDIEGGTAIRLRSRRSQRKVQARLPGLDCSQRRRDLCAVRQVHASRLHLRWLATEDKFKCPCHGIGFYRSGMNFEGPAPRPLDRFQIMRGEDGQLVVDKSKIFRMEPSVEPDEQHPESVLKV